MVMLKITYMHCKEPDMPGCRHGSIKEMEDYLEGLVCEMLLAEIDVKYETIEGDRNEVFINGKTALEIITALGEDIRVPETDEEGPAIITVERNQRDWNTAVIEDISDLLMKNALSKSFAEARELDIKLV